MSLEQEATVIQLTDHRKGHVDDDDHDNSLFKYANRPITLKFEDVVYKIRARKPTKAMFLLAKDAKAEEIPILRGITGVVRPGEILGILGPSGSGKTTLLTVLGGRLGGSRLEGTVTYNGKPFSRALKRATGFVTQDDAMYPHLTVSETLIYTSLLRLPKTLTRLEKVAHAEAVITQLGLTKCRDSIIGNEFMRGVSGGERKRVSIGQEMLVNPSLMLLDEPTSGLDSTIAQRIVRELSGLAKEGRTIVLTIHQPSSRLFYMFNKVLLLSEGNALYFGEGRGMMEYFESVGYAPSIAMNPADFLLDLANGVGPEDKFGDSDTVKQTLISAYKDNLEPKLKKELHVMEEGWNNEGQQYENFCSWPTTWWQQFITLLWRGIKERKHDSFAGVKIAQVLVIGFLCGLLWSQSSIHDLQDKVGLLFFYSSFWGYFPMFNAIFTFPVERMMLEKERSSGTYRLSSYFIARIVGDLPIELILPTIYLIITYWMSGMSPDPVSFIRALFALLYSVLACQGVGLAIGAIVMDMHRAATFGSVVIMSFLLAGGYYVQKVPAFVAWTRYLSISYYTYKLLLASQFDEHSRYPCGDRESCLVIEYPAIREIGLGGQAVAVAVLGLMIILYRAVAYVALMRVGVTKA